MVEDDKADCGSVGGGSNGKPSKIQSTLQLEHQQNSRTTHLNVKHNYII